MQAPPPDETSIAWFSLRKRRSGHGPKKTRCGSIADSGSVGGDRSGFESRPRYLRGFGKDNRVSLLLLRRRGRELVNRPGLILLARLQNG